MKEKRRDSKGRILHTGESQRTDGKYLYKTLKFHRTPYFNKRMHPAHLPSHQKD